MPIIANSKTSQGLYIELLREALLDSIYANPKTINDTENTQESIENGTELPMRAYTMLGRKRLSNFGELIESCLKDGVQGDFLEAGVWRGGACIYARGILKAYEETSRKVFVADSFEGLPPPDAEKYPADIISGFHKIRELSISKEEVMDNFRRFGMLDDQVSFIKGFFEHTLPGNKCIEKLAVLRADGDMYSSTTQILENLYDKVSIGGYVIIDDYGATRLCSKAVDDFRNSRNIKEPFQKIDWTGLYWRKEK